MFPDMATVVPVGKLGVAEVRHVIVNEDDVLLNKMRALFQGGSAYYLPPGRYAQLFVDGTLVMSDTPMERRSNQEIAAKAHGNILIAGLGLGMILHPIAVKEEVTSITVLEICPDVAHLIGRHIPAGVEIVHADVFNWQPRPQQRFDTIYFDIWPDICVDNLEQMKILHRKAAHWRSGPDAYVNSWLRDHLRRLKRAGRWR
jgi:hypothetical protein